MKKLILLATAAIFSLNLPAQTNNLVVFSENGEQFYLIINGVRQNDNPQTNVKVEGLKQNMVKAKVIFADEALGEIDKNVGSVDMGVEAVYKITQNRKGEYKLRPQSFSPISQPAPARPAQTTQTQPQQTGGTSTTVTQTTTTVNGNPQGENVSMGMDVNGMGVNMNVNVSGTATHSQTTTTTTSSSTSTQQQDHYVMQGYNGPIGCPWPMSEGDFQSAMQSIQSKSFEDSKLTMAKQIINTNCLFSSQVRDIMGAFDFEDTRLELAKYAYGYTYDIGNYYKVNDAFDFESSIDELNEYITRQ